MFQCRYALSVFLSSINRSSIGCEISSDNHVIANEIGDWGCNNEGMGFLVSIPRAFLGLAY